VTSHLSAVDLWILFKYIGDEVALGLGDFLLTLGQVEVNTLWLVVMLELAPI
jgi:hypothetical protein